MKRNRLLLVLMTVLSFQLLTAQTYVNQAASGANDGSSWTDAYTNLSTALDNTTSGDIWVAAGTYKPSGDGAGTQMRFGIHNDVNLYGGFAGTEAGIDDRDIAANPTTLSADINGDDVADDFINFKMDNTLHVIYVDSLLTMVTIDGFEVSGGFNNDFNADLDIYLRAGGGIFADSPITVENCSFSQNFSGTGAAITANGPGVNGSSLSDCVFENNLATASGVVYFLNMFDGSLENCQFNNNNTNRGSFYPIFCNTISVNNCIFDSNTNPTGFGAGMWNWQSINLSITNSTFTNNTAQHAAGFYCDQRDVDPNRPEYITISNCIFEGNQAILAGGSTGTGGGIYFWKASYTMTNCGFSANLANSSGGAVYNSGSDRMYTIEGCDFENNTATFGGSLANYSENAFATIIACTFSNNEALTSGGAMINGFKADVTIEDSEFYDNEARWGGAMYNQNDTTKLTISGSEFFGNLVENSGGAINASGKMEITITDSDFGGNQANFGGGIAVSEVDVDGGHLSLENCIFNLNIATQGGGVNISDMDSDIKNCLFYTNIANDTGTGGAISMNAVDSSSLAVNITNSTFASNIGALAGGIASWEGGAEANSVLTLQNNIFYTDFYTNYTVEDGAPEVVSLGGNLSNDESFTALLTHAKDLNGVDQDPLFVDIDDEDFHLATGSPCIDAGVNENSPELDLDGNPRIDDVDMGAYEYDPASAVKEVLVNNAGQVKIAPNPAIANVELIVENNWRGLLNISIANTNGKELKNLTFNKIQEKSKQSMNVTNLPAGAYTVKVSDGKRVITATFVKL